MNKINYRRVHKVREYNVRKQFVCEDCKELFDVKEACHSARPGHGCFCEECFGLRELAGKEIACKDCNGLLCDVCV